MFELMFCTKWEYLIKAIVKAIELLHYTVWYAVEENCIYVSKYYWDNGVKEDVLVLGDEYWHRKKQSEMMIEFIDDPDFDVWYYLSYSPQIWQLGEYRRIFKILQCCGF